MWSRSVIRASVTLALLAWLFVDSAFGTTYENKWVNGTQFAIASDGDIQVWVALTVGADLQALLYVVNGSGERLTFFPENIEVEAVKLKGEQTARIPLRTYSAAEYERKVRNAQGWALAAQAFASSMANQPQPQTTSASGSYTGSYAGTAGYGSYYGTITTWPTAADYAAANALTQVQIQATQAQLHASFQTMAATLMRPHTLEPRTYYGGVVHIKKKRAGSYSVTVPVQGKEFVYAFSFER